MEEVKPLMALMNALPKLGSGSMEEGIMD